MIYKKKSLFSTIRCANEYLQYLLTMDVVLISSFVLVLVIGIMGKLCAKLVIKYRQHVYVLHVFYCTFPSTRTLI